MTSPELKKKPDSLIFDMDGTLWDAVETYTRAWNLYFLKVGIPKQLQKKDLDALMGLEELVFLEAVLPEFPVNERAARYQEVIQLQYDLIDKQGGLIYEGVLTYLPLLSQKYKLFIVSNCPRYTIKHFMKFAKIETSVTDTMAHGENYRAKHENIKLLIEKHELKSPIYIGDTDSDRNQSQKAGVPFIFMTYGFGSCQQVSCSFDHFSSFAMHFLDL